MPLRSLSRRRFSAWVAACAAAPAAMLSQAQEQRPARYLADMHSHYGMFLPRPFGLDLLAHMKETGATLLAWSATDDHRWIGRGPRGIQQLSQPQPGELWTHFQDRIAKYEADLQRWKIPKALVPADIDAALAGQPHVLLACEGASFLEGRPERVQQAHAWGIRHLQLVHFIDNPLGDHQTAEPRHGGITEVGRAVVRECKRLGMVVDLAHATPSFVDGALDASDAAMVWSHSWISPKPWTWQDPGYLARSLPLEQARKIAARGGAVGLWTVRVRNDPQYGVHNVRSFADETLRMCDLVGPAHVAFGTDMEGAGPGPILSDYADLRQVADNLVQRGLPESMLHGIFIGNYARIVKAAMAGASTDART
jgi:membrane dipeptidase